MDDSNNNVFVCVLQRDVTALMRLKIAPPELNLFTDASPWVKVWQAYLTGLNFKKEHHFLSSGDVKRLLDSEGVSYQSHELQSQMDITECFTEGDEKGEVILDFLTEMLHFSKTAPPELKAGVMELLRHPDYGTEIDGRVMFKDVTAMIII